MQSWQRKYRQCQDRTDKTYGYRKVWKCLKDKNIERNPKTVLRVMKKYGLLSEIRRRRKWINLGQQVHKYKNLLNKQFRKTGRIQNGSRTSPTSIRRRVYCICP